MTNLISGAIGIAVCAAVASLGVSAQQNQMSFFITSAGPGNGANLGGLAGADKQCQTLAAAAGAGNRTWRAYLSAAAAAGQPAVNARDRIGKGPWMNAKGVVVAKSVADLHSDANNLGGETSLTEKGTPVPGNQHDILTGSQADGPCRPVMRHAATGPAPRPAGRWSATTTSRAAVRRRPHGTPRTVRKAARSRISSPRAETDTSTASRTDAIPALLLGVPAARRSGRKHPVRERSVNAADACPWRARRGAAAAAVPWPCRRCAALQPAGPSSPADVLSAPARPRPRPPTSTRGASF